MKMSAEEDKKTIEKKRTGIEARRADPPTRRYEPCLDCTMRCYTHNPDMQPTKRSIRQKRDAGHRVFPDTSSSPRLRTLKQNRFRIRPPVQSLRAVVGESFWLGCIVPSGAAAKMVYSVRIENHSRTENDSFSGEHPPIAIARQD